MLKITQNHSIYYLKLIIFYIPFLLLFLLLPLLEDHQLQESHDLHLLPQYTPPFQHI